jgi:ATP-dependent DNA helicase DinG
LGQELAVEEVVVPSPFDFERRALLYTPTDLPAPNARDFIAVSAERIADLVRLSRGGAFVLTTSLRAMRALHRELSRRLAHFPLLLQGEAPKAALIQSFRARESAVLVATQSFWEGVDIPGHALRLVILEKIPFSVPTDPVVRARALALESAGANPFMDLFVPEAALALKQGFGRLLRTTQDAGVVALLDARIHQRSYAKRLLSALPPARRTTELAEVEEVVAALRADGSWPE